jgi:pyrroline-5-carboxylate reductase
MMREYSVDTFIESSSAIADADVVVLAVKPQVMPTVLEDLAGAIEDGQLILSIAAGTTVSGMQQVLGEEQPVVRAQ